jgi:hypothetical protein
LREGGESAEAVVVKIAPERGTERRAEEPRACNQPKRLDDRGAKETDMRGCSNCGSFPSAVKAKPVESGGAGLRGVQVPGSAQRGVRRCTTERARKR